MNPDNHLLEKIKQTVRGVLPDASVILFGSRVAGNMHEESDWDILVLTKKKYEKKIKWAVHDQLYLVALANNTFIHLTFMSENEWKNDAAYYSLKSSITGEMVEL